MNKENDRFVKYTLAKFIASKLRAFREEELTSVPTGLTEEQWDNILRRMVLAFDIVSQNEQHTKSLTDEDWMNIEGGLKLFAEYFMDLWY